MDALQPWEIVKSPKSGWNIVDACGNHVCRIYDGTGGPWRELIARAPALRDALQDGLFVAKAYRAMCDHAGHVPNGLHTSIASMEAALAGLDD